MGISAVPVPIGRDSLPVIEFSAPVAVPRVDTAATDPSTAPAMPVLDSPPDDPLPVLTWSSDPDQTPPPTPSPDDDPQLVVPSDPNTPVDGLTTQLFATAGRGGVYEGTSTITDSATQVVMPPTQVNASAPSPDPAEWAWASANAGKPGVPVWQAGANGIGWYLPGETSLGGWLGTTLSTYGPYVNRNDNAYGTDVTVAQPDVWTAAAANLASGALSQAAYDAFIKSTAPNGVAAARAAYGLPASGYSTPVTPAPLPPAPPPPVITDSGNTQSSWPASPFAPSAQPVTTATATATATAAAAATGTVPQTITVEIDGKSYTAPIPSAAATSLLNFVVPPGMQPDGATQPARAATTVAAASGGGVSSSLLVLVAAVAVALLIKRGGT